MEGGKEGVYIGESARTAFNRGADHLSAMRTLNEESPLVEHSLKAHGERVPRFKMEILKYCKTNLMRQAMEANRIQSMVGKNLLNRRGGGGRTSPQIGP